MRYKVRVQAEAEVLLSPFTPRAVPRQSPLTPSRAPLPPSPPAGGSQHVRATSSLPDASAIRLMTISIKTHSSIRTPFSTPPSPCLSKAGVAREGEDANLIPAPF